MKIPAHLRRGIGLGLLGLLVLVALGFTVMRSGPLAPTRVTVVAAGEGRLEPALFGIGTVEARRAYLIGPTTAARVRRVAVDVGDTVKAGQLLAEMDPVDLDERLLALDASLARAGSAVAAAQAQRQDALAKKALAATNAARYVGLGQRDFMSTGAVEAKLQEQASAEAALGATDANVAAARQDLQRLAAERAGLSQQRDNLRLLAPSDGVVISREAEAGSTVVAGQAVLRVIDPSSLWVKARLDQARSAGLASGLAARIVLRSDPAQALPGKVVRVEAQSDSVTEERVVQVGFETLPAGLSLGELAEVTLQLPATAKAVLLPNASIRHQAGQAGVWRVAEGGLHWLPVRVGAASLDGQVQVLQGVRAGERIVVHSEKELDAGSRIRIVEALVGSAP
jgi:HlyD family secretion protein